METTEFITVYNSLQNIIAQYEKTEHDMLKNKSQAVDKQKRKQNKQTTLPKQNPFEQKPPNHHHNHEYELMSYAAILYGEPYTKQHYKTIHHLYHNGATLAIRKKTNYLIINQLHIPIAWCNMNKQQLNIAMQKAIVEKLNNHDKEAKQYNQDYQKDYQTYLKLKEKFKHREN